MLRTFIFKMLLRKVLSTVLGSYLRWVRAISAFVGTREQHPVDDSEGCRGNTLKTRKNQLWKCKHSWKKIL